MIQYSTFCFFNVDMGIIKVRDFYIKKAEKEISMQVTGIKHIIFSNEFIKNSDYEFMTLNSFPIPNLRTVDGKSEIKGCNLRLFPNKSIDDSNKWFIKLAPTDNECTFQYRSNIVTFENY